jgi:glutathione peroxidase
MKHLIILLSFLFFASTGEVSGFYGIKFNDINGNLINTNAYQGKKVIVTLLGINTTSMMVVRYLDSVQRAHTDWRVVAVPTGEFGADITLTTLINLQKTLKLTITQPLKVRRINGSNQHPFFAWLTDVAKNKHFDMDADEEGKAFIISGKGTLYSVLSRQTPKALIGQILNAPFDE